MMIGKNPFTYPLHAFMQLIYLYLDTSKFSTYKIISYTNYNSIN